MPPKSKERKKVARVVPAKAKKREGFQSSSSSAMAGSGGAKAEKKKRQRRECSYPYCESKARKGGLCRKHGVKCSAEGCWRQVVRGGVCTVSYTHLTLPTMELV